MVLSLGQAVRSTWTHIHRFTTEAIEFLTQVRLAAPATYKRFVAQRQQPVDLEGHRRLTRATTTPIAVGESIYSIRHFREYMAKAACSIVQVDAARIGGITPWLKVAHMAEAFDMPLCPHFLMELHVSLTCAVPNGKYVEYIPQLDDLTTSSLRIEDGMAVAPMTPGIGVEWDLDTMKAMSLPEFSLAFGRGGTA